LIGGVPCEEPALLRTRRRSVLGDEEPGGRAS
jgi:hypothetical protein